MNIRERLARFIAPSMQTEDQVKALVASEIKAARAALPIVSNYDPNNEGYRRLTGSLQTRDLPDLDHDVMFDIAYYMWDHSAGFRRLNLLNNTFLFGEPIQIICNHPKVQDVIDQFCEDSLNQIALDFPEHMMWLSILGEQCWPVTVTEGHVTLAYVDPADIKEVYMYRKNKKRLAKVVLRDQISQSGEILQIIQKNDNPADKKGYGRLTGDCFFFAINHPPNSPRGRSDYLTLFDWIDAWERYGFNYLDRAELMLNFIWDVTLKGMDEAGITDWLQKTSPPQPGNLRAHNENVEWKAVTPDLKATDFKGGFDMAKSYIMGAAGRPDSWFGTGGKAYQNEADLMGLVPIKDLDRRQLLHKYQLQQIIQFVIDQAIIARRLSGSIDLGFKVIMPEISKKDLTKIAEILPQATNSLTIANSEGLLTKKTASRVLVSFINQMGEEIDPEKEFEEAQLESQQKEEDKKFQDYINLEKTRQQKQLEENLNDQAADIRKKGKRINQKFVSTRR